jgi:DNA gyrase/topoisomerase IV subunit B
MANKMSMSSSSSNLDEKYQQKTDKEHILDNPDTYIGSIENVSGPMYIYEDKIIQKDIDYNPALYKLFDEGITNCRDHRVRTEIKKKTCCLEKWLILKRHLTFANCQFFRPSLTH